MLTVDPRGAGSHFKVKELKPKRQNKTFRPRKISQESEIDTRNLRPGQIRVNS